MLMAIVAFPGTALHDTVQACRWGKVKGMTMLLCCSGLIRLLTEGCLDGHHCCKDTQAPAHLQLRTIIPGPAHEEHQKHSGARGSKDPPQQAPPPPPLPPGRA